MESQFLVLGASLMIIGRGTREICNEWIKKSPVKSPQLEGTIFTFLELTHLAITYCCPHTTFDQLLVAFGVPPKISRSSQRFRSLRLMTGRYPHSVCYNFISSGLWSIVLLATIETNYGDFILKSVSGN